ncbi:MAG: phosphatase PAP2 family protein [Alphaproteobacteria bacterium]|nr:phosphatase PAP2 family protein [Alphaproteobacteria bacterium]
MSRLRTLAMFPVCATLITANSAFANDFVKEIGNYMQVIVPAYAFGMAMNESDWQGSRQFAYSFAATELSVLGLKSVIDETRPNGSNKNSFPSGHTAAAFNGAVFIHKRYGFNRAIIPYMMAGFTGYSRIASDMHYLHDVVAGAAIGGLFSWFLTSKYENVCLSAGNDHVNVQFKTSF